MLGRVSSAWFRFGSDRPGFFLGTCLLSSLMLLMFAAGIQATLSLGPGGEFPGFRDVLLYSFSHDDLPSLLVSLVLVLVGLGQERRWGTVSYLVLVWFSVVLLPLLYTLVLFVCGAEASRVSGYSAVGLVLFTARCRQPGRRRLLRVVPVWFLPWILLLLGLLVLPGTPALLHFCAICIGHNYHQSFIGMFQELEESSFFTFIPESAYISTSARFRLPSYSSRSELVDVDQAAPAVVSDSSRMNHHHHHHHLPPDAASSSSPSPSQLEVEVLEQQLLHAGIMASLQDLPDEEEEEAKVEVPKSSVSSLRLQQLQQMGFSTDKAVVALAASKQLDDAISLLIDGGVGERAVVTSKGKNVGTPHNT